MKKILILSILSFSFITLTGCSIPKEKVIIQESGNTNDVFYKKAKCRELANDFIEIENKNYGSNAFDIYSTYYIQESETCLLVYRLFIDLENQQYYVIDLLTNRMIMDSQNVGTKQFEKFNEFSTFLKNKERDEFEENIGELKKYIW